ncbi:hypothetical protein [Euryhalocaulis caribicus]|uniref:hypothetical protein n=1 Tax=Euryhalocaulis caribicus TaxID=1161401 RepID=UPI0003B5EF8A|nr:hypothetical protein [Euryhalocaulis caribicus]
MNKSSKSSRIYHLAGGGVASIAAASLMMSGAAAETPRRGVMAAGAPSVSGPGVSGESIKGIRRSKQDRRRRKPTRAERRFKQRMKKKARRGAGNAWDHEVFCERVRNDPFRPFTNYELTIFQRTATAEQRKDPAAWLRRRREFLARAIGGTYHG